jgi:hypothetical protein
MFFSGYPLELIPFVRNTYLIVRDTRLISFFKKLINSLKKMFIFTLIHKQYNKLSTERGGSDERAKSFSVYGFSYNVNII